MARVASASPRVAFLQPLTYWLLILSYVKAPGSQRTSSSAGSPRGASTHTHTHTHEKTREISGLVRPPEWGTAKQSFELGRTKWQAASAADCASGYLPTGTLTMRALATCLSAATSSAHRRSGSVGALPHQPVAREPLTAASAATTHPSGPKSPPPAVHGCAR